MSTPVLFVNGPRHGQVDTSVADEIWYYRAIGRDRSVVDYSRKRFRVTGREFWTMTTAGTELSDVLDALAVHAGLLDPKA